jgi:hypothetical protein
LQITLDDSRIAERQPEYRELIAQFRRALDDFHTTAAQDARHDDPQAG